MIKLEKRITDSVGYKNVMIALKEVFGNEFEVIDVIPTDDDTSFDFRSNVNIFGTSGIDINVNTSGNSHQFQLGDGFVAVAIPIKEGFFNLPSGKQGELLEDVLGMDIFKSSPSANNLDRIIEYFLKLKEYLKSVDRLD